MASPFSSAFLTGDPRAEAFLPGAFRRPEARAACVARAAERQVSTQTMAALRAQAARFGQSEARAQSLSALEQPGTVVVVTGQQVGLFLGPLYAVYKAATAVMVARALEAETKRRCVPVFWLQTEDHDFEEINHCHVQGRDGVVHRLEVAGPAGRGSIATRVLGEGVTAQLSALQNLIGEEPHGEALLSLLRAQYRPDARWTDAFAGVLSTLFDELVLIDPREEALAAQVRPVHRRAITEAEPIALAMLARSAELEAAGFAVQVHVREHAPLSFFHPEGPEGPRARIERATPEVLEALERSALSVSTSALLRPIVQDTLLPTAAIVGGPGELNYFAQMRPMYDAFALPMPMLVPRARFRVIEPRVASTLAKLGLTASEVEAPASTLLARLRQPGVGPNPEALAQQVVSAVEPLLQAVPTGDPDVADAVKRTQATIARAAQRLAGRYSRSLLRVDTTVSSRLERVQAALFPHGEPQERVLALPSFAARFGRKEFIALVLSRLQPFDTTVVELTP